MTSLLTVLNRPVCFSPAVERRNTGARLENQSLPQEAWETPREACWRLRGKTETANKGNALQW